MKWKRGREGGRDGRDWKWATFELLYVRGSSFPLVLSAVPGNRSQGRTWDCAHSSLLPSLTLAVMATSPSAPLPLVTCLLPLLSLLSCHYSPSISLLLLALITFCHLLSFPVSTLSVPPPSLSASSPASLSRFHSPPRCLLLSSLTVLKWFTSPMYSQSPQSNQFPAPKPMPTDSKAVMEHVSIIFYHLLVLCFQWYPIILMLNWIWFQLCDCCWLS